ncbi:hypothetical protein [Acinetobacter sp.]|nr:hypothetical protein [Acinetobacter sp.]
MNTVQFKKNLHPFKKFLIELFSVRAGLYIKQNPTFKGSNRA